MEPDPLLILELSCCCCGRVLESLSTPWRLEDVQPEVIWTRQPCEQCQRNLELDDALWQLPPDLRETIRTYLRAGVDVHLVPFDD